MCDGRRRREDAEEAADGMQNQKQEPHTKMWGKIVTFKFLLHFSYLTRFRQTCHPLGTRTMRDLRTSLHSKLF